MIKNQLILVAKWFQALRRFWPQPQKGHPWLYKDPVSVHKPAQSKYSGAHKHTQISQCSTIQHKFTHLSTLNIGEMQEVQPCWWLSAQGRCTAKCCDCFHRLAASKFCLPTLRCRPNVPLLRADSVNISPLVHANIPQCSVCLWTCWNRLLRPIWHFC